MLVDLKYNVAPGVIDARGLWSTPDATTFCDDWSEALCTIAAHTYSWARKAPLWHRAEAIKHYPPIRAGWNHPTIANHRAADIRELNLTRLRHTPKDGGRHLDWDEELQLECHRDYDGYSDVYGRMKWDAPAPTLTCRCYSISNGRYGHPNPTASYILS